ncbi:hypothetical protein L3Q82_015119, partial [Scortum barcoo]
MAEHHAASDGKHKAAANAGGSANSRPGPAGGGGAGRGGLSGGLTQPAGWQSLLSFSILFLACLAGFSSRLFAVIRFESIIHEFDPWSQRAALWASAPAYREEKKGGSALRKTRAKTGGVGRALREGGELRLQVRCGGASPPLSFCFRFNYRSTHHLTSNGFYEFLNWFDERAWYPLGRIVGGTVYPGLMVTAGLIHYVLNLLHITVPHPRRVRVPGTGVQRPDRHLHLPADTGAVEPGRRAAGGLLHRHRPWLHLSLRRRLFRQRGNSHLRPAVHLLPLGMCSFTCWKALQVRQAGEQEKTVLTLSSSMSVPGEIGEDRLGILDHWLLSLLFLHEWPRGHQISPVSAWGGYVFIINLIPLHVFVLLLMQRYSRRVYIAYSTFYIVGLVLSMQIPFVGFQPIRTSEHMAAAGVFALLQAYAFLQYLKDRLTRQEFQTLFFLGVSLAAGVVFLTVIYLTYTGYIAPWSGRFYSLWDTGYAKIHIPIIASVSEHQPTTWVSFFFDLHILVCTFPAGLWFCIKNINDERVFGSGPACTPSAPSTSGRRDGASDADVDALVVCMLSAVAFSSVFEHYMGDDTKREKPPAEDSSDEDDKRNSGNLYDKAGKVRKHVSEQEKAEEGLGPNIKSIVTMLMLMLLMMFAVHCTWVTSNAYSSPSVVLASYNHDGTRNILDDFREAYYWLRQNTDEHARVMSCASCRAKRISSPITVRLTILRRRPQVGKAMSSNESAAYKIMRSLDVDYVLIIFGGVIGYSGDDINKFLWMVRIAEGEHPKDIRESDYFTPQGEFRVDKAGSPTLLNCLMYKMSYYRFGEMQLDFRTPPGFDRTRNAEIGNKDIKFKHLEEAFTSEHWLVRIYKVKNLDNREPLDHKLRSVVSKQKYTSKK